MARQPFVIYNMRETYHELGFYEFKIVLDPRSFKNGHFSEVSCVDSDGKPVWCDVAKWGRKINCKINIDQKVADGVATVNMLLKDDDGKSLQGRARFWVIKP